MTAQVTQSSQAQGLRPSVPTLLEPFYILPQFYPRHLPPIRTYAALDSDRDVGGGSHGGAAVCHQLRLQHEAGTEAALPCYLVTAADYESR